MSRILHITSGDIAGSLLAEAGLPGDVFVWHDILYDGPRNPGWPTAETLGARARFIAQATGGGLDPERVLDTFHRQYDVLAGAADRQAIVLWFDACLFDQSMLAHVMTCLRHQRIDRVELIGVDGFPGIEPFHGLGQLQPGQLAGLFPGRVRVTDAQFAFAARVDEAFATQDLAALAVLVSTNDAPLPWVPAAVTRWLEEQPDPATGLGRLQRLALAAIRAGCETPDAVYRAVAAGETPPQFWGDTTLWATINTLAARVPPLVHIDGPADRLPQWPGDVALNRFRVTATKRASAGEIPAAGVSGAIQLSGRVTWTAGD